MTRPLSPPVQIAPRGDAFREFVALLARINAAGDDEEAYGMRRFAARPKYVLRKLTFSILPEGTAARDRFVQEVLGLGGAVCTQQRQCVKEDLRDILFSICLHRPDLACIPTTFCHKD